jgi:hypothetical protein
MTQYEVTFYGEHDDPKRKIYDTLQEAEEEFESFPAYDAAFVDVYIRGHNNSGQNYIGLYVNQVYGGEILNTRQLRQAYVDLGKCPNPGDYF